MLVFNVDLPSDTATVLYDPALCDAGDLVEAMAAVGFRPETTRAVSQ